MFMLVLCVQVDMMEGCLCKWDQIKTGNSDEFLKAVLHRDEISKFEWNSGELAVGDQNTWEIYYGGVFSVLGVPEGLFVTY